MIAPLRSSTAIRGRIASRGIRWAPRALLALLGGLPLAAAVVPRRRPPVPVPVPVRETGSIQGTVRLSATLSARRPRFRIYAEPGPGAVPPPREQDELRNVVLYLERAPSPARDGAAEPRLRAAIHQNDERFVPHVLPVLQGTTVDFPNDDDIFHNVFSLSSAKQFDLGRYPRGASKAVTFEKPGVVQVFCHIHSDMSAIVLVLENPYFAAPDAAGAYTIDNVPPGDYTIVGWHERIRPVPHRVHVVAGQATRVDFNIPLPSTDAATSPEGH